LRLLLDTRLVLWVSGDLPRLSPIARALIEDPDHQPFFSAVNIWEIAIKHALDRQDFVAYPHEVRLELIQNGYRELPVSSFHAAAVAGLPNLHRDPLDRLLVAQAMVEGMTLLTADAQLGSYPGSIRVV
jgi:PIN domain nuclease of toxin-antitoxin system